MQYTDQQLKVGEDAYAEFVAKAGTEFSPYIRPTVGFANTARLISWICANHPGGLPAADSPAVWRLAFRKCRAAGVLRRAREYVN
jgi:hypothetical protein